jgi:enoyl-CoA hydratase
MAYLKWSVQDQVGTITINHPPANALSSKLFSELSFVLDEVEQDLNVRVIVMHGEGLFFSAGADIKEFTTIETNDQFSRLAKNGQDLFERIEKFPKPSIAAIHGAALGGGLELAMACTFRLVSTQAKLGLPELQLGLIPGFAGTQRLPRYVGMGLAAEMMLTSEPITGEEAVMVGLANHAYLESELLEEAYILARKIAKKSPVSIKAALELLQFAKTEKYYAGVQKEAELFGKVFTSEDAKEGITAFLNKRKPNFIGQ